MMRICRAFFRCQNEDESNLLVDLILTDRRHLPKRVPFFGSWGRLNSRSIYPFVLQDGRLDFGDEVESGQDHSSRFAAFDVDDRIIAAGDDYTLSYQRHTYIMTLEKLTDLEQLVKT
jgi:hypothetical protein